MVLTQSRIWTLIRSKENLFLVQLLNSVGWRNEIFPCCSTLWRGQNFLFNCTQGVNVQGLWVKNYQIYKKKSENRKQIQMKTKAV